MMMVCDILCMMGCTDQNVHTIHTLCKMRVVVDNKEMVEEDRAVLRDAIDEDLDDIVGRVSCVDISVMNRDWHDYRKEVERMAGRGMEEFHENMMGEDSEKEHEGSGRQKRVEKIEREQKEEGDPVKRKRAREIMNKYNDRLHIEMYTVLMKLKTHHRLGEVGTQSSELDLDSISDSTGPFEKQTPEESPSAMKSENGRLKSVSDIREEDEISHIHIHNNSSSRNVNNNTSYDDIEEFIRYEQEIKDILNKSYQSLSYDQPISSSSRSQVEKITGELTNGQSGNKLVKEGEKPHRKGQSMKSDTSMSKKSNTTINNNNINKKK